MEKFISLITIAITNLMMPLLSTAHAQSSPCPKNFESLCKLDPNSNPRAFDNLFNGIIQILWIISIIGSLFYLIWGGIRWIKANGDKGEIEQARKTIISAMIGLGISFLAFFIINTIVYLVTGQSGFQIVIPKLN